MIWQIPFLYQFDIITYIPKFQNPNCWSAQFRRTWYCFQQFVKNKSFLWFIEVVFGDWCGYRRRQPKLCPRNHYIKVHITCLQYQKDLRSPPPYFKQRWDLSIPSLPAGVLAFCQQFKFLKKQRDLQYKGKYKVCFILITSLKLLTYY